MDIFFGMALKTAVFVFLLVLFLSILIVAFWAWFVTKIAIETYDRHRKKYSSEEIDLYKAQIQQLQNQLTCMIQINNNIQKMNTTVEKLSDRIDNTILYKNTPHM